jgi:AbrB family looped-hinge helix DNA binding protein
MPGHIATITSKGQVTVPAEVRRYMELREGDRVLFVREAGRVYINRLPAVTSSAEVYGVLRRPGGAPLDVEQARADGRVRRQSRHVVSKSDGQGQLENGR